MFRALLFAAAIGVLAVAALGGASTVSAHRAASGAVALRQVLGKGDTMQVVLSDAGASATETRGKSRTGVIVRYEDGAVFPLNYEQKAYMTQTIEGVTAELRRERSLIDAAQTEIPLLDGSHLPRLRFPTLTPLKLEAKIAGALAHAYLLRQQNDKTQVRLWLADELPAAPEVVQAALGGAISLPLTSQHALLRVEMLIGKGWVTGLDTTDIREIEVTKQTFAPPEGWREQRPPKIRQPASIPALPLRWFGPVSTNPDVFALYWNGPFSFTFVSTMNTLLSSMVGGGATASAFWTPLGQYGVARGRFIGSSPITFPLPATVGSWNFFAIGAMVTASYFTTSVPKIWWRVGARDPIIAIMVPSTAVASGGWGGYHLVNLSLGAFLPWPVSMAAHPEIPWLIAKSSPLTSAPDSTTTTNVSHELVETASDPLPLSANLDYTKSPPWSGAELADICSFGSPLPASPTIFRFGATLQKYWSRSVGACVG